MTDPARRPLAIVLAEDDPDGRFLAEEALREARILNPLHSVEDGEELLQYLRREGRWAHLAGQPLPALILLDLNMPRMDGREALRAIKSDPALRGVPVVVLTTSREEEDILRSYELGASSFISKPVDLPGLVAVMTALGQYWLELVRLPSAR